MRSHRIKSDMFVVFIVAIKITKYYMTLEYCLTDLSQLLASTLN